MRTRPAALAGGHGGWAWNPVALLPEAIQYMRLTFPIKRLWAQRRSGVQPRLSSHSTCNEVFRRDDSCQPGWLRVHGAACVWHPTARTFAL